MCGRFYLDAPPDELMGEFGLETTPALPPRYNIAPSQLVAAVVEDKQGRKMQVLHWGLIPFWAKDEKIGYRTINARAETVDSKPAFRAAFKYRRCLIPASGFFEWKAEAGGKQPYCIRPKQGSLFAFAGLYEHWEGEGGKLIDSCSIIVTEANQAVKPVHDRMPVILSRENFAAWLDPNNQVPRLLKPLLMPSPDEIISVYSVSKRVNNPRNDDPECIARLS